MRRRLPLLGLLLFAAGCDYYYNNIPSPDDLLHLVPWFDAMITSPAVHPYQRSGIPRNTVPGTVPVTGGEADWFAEWNAGNTTTADRLVNPLAGQPATARSDSVFQTFCAVCHGVAGAGDGPVGPKIAAPSLLTPRALGLTDGYFYSIIRYGGRVMPRYGDRIGGPVRWEVVNYVRQLQGAVKTPPDSATNPPRGAN